MALHHGEEGEGAVGGGVAEEAGGGAGGEEGVEDLGGVVVVDALGISLCIAGGHEGLEIGEEGVVVGDLVVGVGCGEVVGEVLGAVDLVVLGDGGLVPEVAEGEEALVLDGLEVVGAAEVEAHLVRRAGRC